MITRRRLLQYGLVSTALLGAAGGLAWFRLGYRLREGEVPIALSTKQFVVARAIVETLLPADGDLPSGVDLGVPQRVDEEVWASPDELRADMTAGLLLFEHLPPLFGFAGRFTSLSQADREACFERYLRSDQLVLVQVASAFRQMCQLFYYVHPRTWGAIGYDGPWVAEPRPPASAVAYRALVDARRAG